MSLTDFRHMSADAVADAPPAAVGEDSAKAAPSPPADENILAIVPVRQFVLFPGVVMPVTLKDPAAIAAAQHAVRQSQPIGLAEEVGGERGIRTPGAFAQWFSRPPPSTTRPSLRLYC